ncbi:hypothetical protein, conserved [Eimeria praecox]|uniref:Uncharacterized protein n=1 Tax=Eimeria praecox TaxID=51316 RepID=U6H9H9_9EIME|nr:hypothetical protein, conserved [Eimeria praecox]
MWLISFTLLMVLTSSLSFASTQFRPAGDALWIDFAIFLNWGVVFGACVIMWSLARLFNSEKTEWKLLYLSLFTVLVPRSCLPFRFGEFVIHQMCFMGISFFTDHISWKTNTFCGLTLIIMTISDFTWKVLPPFVALLKFYAFVITVLVGNLGYRIVQVFYKQLREAVHRRLILCKDDMLRYVVEIEESGVWNKEKEPQLFVVPSCHYGYVDCKWYLDMSLHSAHGGLFRCPFGNAVEDRQALPATSTPSEREALNGAAVSMHSPAAAYTALMGIDSVTAVKRYSTLFRSALSVERSPSDLCKSGESDRPPSPLSCSNDTQQNASMQQPGGPQLVERAAADAHASNATVQRFCLPYLPHKEDRVLTEKNGHDIPPAGSLHTSPQGKDECQRRPQAEKGRRSFRPRRLGWKLGPTKSAECSNCPRAQEETRRCGCLRHPWAGERHRRGENREPHASSGSREEAVLPKLKWGVFEDSAIERWYLLWRAEYIISFYKEICHINLLVCALQCLFEMTRRYAVECLSQAIERYKDTNAAELEFLGVRAQMPSWTRTLAVLWRPVLQFAILSALILPMKFMESRGGKNAWKFQLLAFGQAVTYTAFAFCELLGKCCIMATEPLFTTATKIPKGVELTFVVGGHLILPLFSIAVTVHMRRIPEATILVISVGSALVTIVFLSVVGWEFKIAAFFMLSRTLYALFSIMLVRAFENVRRQLFATQVLPFLMYLSTLANSQRVENLCAIRRERDHCGYQQAESSLP